MQSSVLEIDFLSREMTPHTGYSALNSIEFDEPISRTYQYRKVLKPMLERKRRARINRCLDELKDLMMSALKSEGENVTKLEKADILEITVRHLHHLRTTRRLNLTPESSYADRFRQGYMTCAQEVSSFFTTPLAEKVHSAVREQFINHLGECLGHLERSPSSTGNFASWKSTKDIGHIPRSFSLNVYTPPQSPVSDVSYSRASSETSDAVWRPWWYLNFYDKQIIQKTVTSWYCKYIYNTVIDRLIIPIRVFCSI